VALLQINRFTLVWSLIHIALLLMVFTPLGLIGASLLMTPIVVQSVKLKPGVFSMVFAGNVILTGLAAALLGWAGAGFVAMLLALFFLIPSLVMRMMYKRQTAAHSVLIAGVVTILAQLLLLLLILYSFGYNVTTYVKQGLTESMTMAESVMNMNIPQESIDTLIRTVSQTIPLYLILFSVFYVVVTHAVSRYALQKSGETIAGLKPMREWKLPKSLVWYYLIALLASFIVTDPDSVISVMLLNLIPLLMLAFAVQAASLLFFAADVKQWSRSWIIVLLIVLGMVILVIPPLLQIIALIGVFDVAFPLRDRLKKSK